MSAISNNPASAASASLVVDSNRPQVQQPQKAQSTAATQPVSALSEGENVQFETYTVKKGDTLWDIAGVKLGDPKEWGSIFALNKSQIKNPDLIYPGQTLTLPKKIQVAPTPPPTQIPSPVDYEPPAPAQPAPPAAPPAPPAVSEPAQPVLPPVAEQPATPPASPPSDDPFLRDPSEIPYPAPNLPDVADKPAPVAPAEPPVVSEPVAPAPSEPTAPAPTAPPLGQTPDAPPLADVGKPTAKSMSGVGKAAIIGGVVGTVGTGATLIAMTRSAGNLGGYQTAQVVAKGVNGVIGKVGLKVPTGPTLSKIVKKVGGPKVAGSVTAVGVGLVVAGVAAGTYAIYDRATSKEGTVASLQQPKPEVKQQPAAAPANNEIPLPATAGAATPAAAQPAAAPADNAFADVQPVVDLSPLKNQLTELLDDKKYMFFGAPNQPDEIRGTAVQIWEQGTMADKVELSQTLVGKGQSEVLGRILTHESVNPLATTEVMSQAGFPVSQFMNDLSDNRAFIVLDKLATVSAQYGEPNSAKLLGQIVESYDGTFSDREKPFKQLRQQHQSTGTWAQLPNSVTAQINKLLK